VNRFVVVHPLRDVSQVSGAAKGKTSYLAKTGDLSCSDGAKPVGRDDVVKT
jgi:hypothetical protein